MGHDEYWTNSMRDAVLGARDAGTNLAFLGANTMYWRIRLEPAASGAARVVVGYRHAAHLDPLYAQGSPDATANFREAPDPRPEHDLLGMQYECYPVDTDYVVVSPGWWGFRGTGVRRGDHVPGLVGPEADRVYPDARLPRPLQVLSHSPYSCRGVATSAQSVYYSTPSGAGVFNAGTLRWGCAMVDRCERPLGRATQRFTRTVTGTLVTEFAAGTGRRKVPGARQRRRVRPLPGQHGRGELRQCGSDSAMMTRMGMPRLARRRGGSVVVVWLATACSSDAPPQDTETPDAAALQVRTVTGAERLDERTRADVEGAVGDVLSAYVVEAFLGEYPREEFVRSFESFTGEAARDAAGDIDLLTAAAVPDATAVLATDLDARLSFLTRGPHGPRRHRDRPLRLRGHREDGSTQPITLDGRFMMEAEEGTWSVFGYDVRFDDGDGRAVEVESGSPSATGPSS